MERKTVKNPHFIQAVVGTVTASKVEASGADQAAITNGVGMMPLSGGGRLIQTTPS